MQGTLRIKQFGRRPPMPSVENQYVRIHPFPAEIIHPVQPQCGFDPLGGMPRGRMLLYEEHGPEELHGEAVRREPDRQVPYRLGDLVPVHLEDRPGVIHAGHEHADEGLTLCAAHGVPHEHHPLPAEPLQRGAGREPRNVAPARLPPPLEVSSVVPPVGEAVEPALRERALGAVVERVADGVVGHPGAVEHVARPAAKAQAQAGVPDEARGGEFGASATSPADVAEHVVERAGLHERRGGQEERAGRALQRRRARGRPPPPPAPERRESGRGRRGALESTRWSRQQTGFIYFMWLLEFDLSKSIRNKLEAYQSIRDCFTHCSSYC